MTVASVPSVCWTVTLTACGLLSWGTSIGTWNCGCGGAGVGFGWGWGGAGAGGGPLLTTRSTLWWGAILKPEGGSEPITNPCGVSLGCVDILPGLSPLRASSFRAWSTDIWLTSGT